MEYKKIGISKWNSDTVPKTTAISLTTLYCSMSDSYLPLVPVMGTKCICLSLTINLNNQYD